MASESSSSNTSRGIGFVGLLTLVLVILKLNPGDYLTTVVVDWPWFEWWGVSVFCPFVYSVYLTVAILVVVGSFVAFVAAVAAVSKS